MSTPAVNYSTPISAKRSLSVRDGGSKKGNRDILRICCLVGQVEIMYPNDKEECIVKKNRKKDSHDPSLLYLLFSDKKALSEFLTRAVCKLNTIAIANW